MELNSTRPTVVCTSPPSLTPRSPLMRRPFGNRTEIAACVLTTPSECASWTSSTELNFMPSPLQFCSELVM